MDPKTRAFITAHRADHPDNYALRRSHMTPEMEAILRAGRSSVPVVGWRALSREIGYAADTIRGWARALGLDTTSIPPLKLANGQAWGDAKIDKLRALWAEGLTTKAIAERLQVTTNSVIGISHRLGLPARKRAIKRVSVPKPPKPVRKYHVSKPPKPPRLQWMQIRAPAEDGGAGIGPLPWVKVPDPPRAPHRKATQVRVGPVRECAFPMWAHSVVRPPKPAPFCCAPTMPGRPYCEGHFVVAYVQVQTDAA